MDEVVKKSPAEEITEKSVESKFLLREMVEHIRDIEWEFDKGELIRAKRKINKLIAQLITAAEKESK